MEHPLKQNKGAEVIETAAETWPERMLPAEAARYLRRSYGTLARWRCVGGGPPYRKLGPTPQAKVIYLKSEIDAWLEASTLESTSSPNLGA